jgi:hypothetical protein
VVSTSVFFVLALTTFALSGDAPETPIGTKWWPSEGRPGNQRGAANRLTPQKGQEAAQLIRAGKVYSLGRMYESGMTGNPRPGEDRNRSWTAGKAAQTQRHILPPIWAVTLVARLLG